MNFDRSEIQAMLIDSAERLLAEQAGVEYWREQRRNTDGFDRQRWATFGSSGRPCRCRNRRRLGRLAEDVASSIRGARRLPRDYVSTAP